MNLCVVLIVILGVLFSDVMAEEDLNKDQGPEVSEKPIQLIHVLNPGEREYLSPNLIGVQNIAMTFLPLSYNFINIIDAYREIVNGVRYEILLNAIESKDEKICQLVILEKPWLRTEWGDKVRELTYSNCTGGSIDNVGEGTTASYNAIVKPRDELTENEMERLESQIITTVPTPTTDDGNDITTSPNELRDNEKSLLDDFFGISKVDSGSLNTALEDIDGNVNNPQAEIEHMRSKRNTNERINTVPSALRELFKDRNKMEYIFSKYELKFNKKYENSAERQMRLRIFTENMRKIEELNRNELGSAKYGLTQFADLTSDEFKEYTGLLATDKTNDPKKLAVIPNVPLPKEFDWREKGMITRVKNQGSCGSCWAFSVTGNIEGLHAIKSGKVEEYSEQELLDCDTDDSACNGGLPDNAFSAIKKIGGLELENEYPYAARKQSCLFNETKVHVKVKDFVDMPKNETAMAQWLITNGPISIGINANAMQFYRGGVSHPWKPLCSRKNLDHGVLIVGFGVSEYPTFKKTLPYWIIKNSWGTKWGEQGYYRVYRGDNTCGVSEMASSAILADE